MVATSGDLLINSKAITDLQTFLPHATLITPNKHEAEILLEEKITEKNVHQAAHDLGKKYKTAVLLKVGNLNKSSQNMSD